MPLNRLDGLTVWHETRREEEDIENVHNMATADIVDLLVDTRIPAGRVIDWIDQAILWTQLGPDEATNADESSARRRLAKHGVRTASSLLKVAYHKSQSDYAAFAGVLVDEQGQPVIRSILSAIQTNGTWRASCGGEVWSPSPSLTTRAPQPEAASGRQANGPVGATGTAEAGTLTPTRVARRSPQPVCA
jgi:hypothetical protein